MGCMAASIIGALSRGKQFLLKYNEAHDAMATAFAGGDMSQSGLRQSSTTIRFICGSICSLSLGFRLRLRLRCRLSRLRSLPQQQRHVPALSSFNHNISMGSSRRQEHCQGSKG